MLISADAITEDAYLTALAASLGTSYERLDDISRADCPLDDNQLIQAAAAGLLPVREAGEIIWIIAPRCLTARRLASESRPTWLQSFRLTSSERLLRFVTQHAQNALGRHAAGGLRRSRPLLSNAPRRHGAGRIAALALVLLAVTLLFLASAAAIEVFATLLCMVFLGAAALRFASVAFARQAPHGFASSGDHKLPIYTIICALYREANVVNDLVAAIPFARGSFTVVYDAEDVPEPDQLRRAFATFVAADERLACVQATLTVDNTTDSWLARMFTAAYAGQFDAFLPGLAALHLPFPLGGSSNHFRTAVLRQVGAWDPYNVTEDADLGIRLYRFGYRSTALSSATYEEAPARFGPWLKQRTRWYKGWMQTWLVHMRRPVRLVRELNPAGAIAFQLFLACNVLAALIHPVFMAGLCWSLLAAPPLQIAAAMDAAPVFAATFFCGYASTIALDLVGLRRRGLLAHAWVLVLTPLYWFLLSLAAWRALFQLLHDPQRWEKTEHGLARTSRLSGSDYYWTDRSRWDERPQDRAQR